MCRVEERVYIAVDGTRKTFEDSFPCHKSRKGRLCSNVERKTIEYRSQSQAATAGRAGTSSPASINPLTPTESGNFYVEERRPSGVTRRPSTRDGKKSNEPRILIEFGARKDKKYHSSKGSNYKRSSLAGSINADDVAIESPGSDASYTVRTGYPEATSTAVPLQHPTGYSTRPAEPRGHHHHTSSASSFTTSSQPPSLYATSDPDSPSTRRPPRYPPTIVHNPPPGSIQPPSPPVTRAPTQPTHATQASANTYRTTLHTPKSSRDNIGADGVFPLDYTGYQPTSANASSSRVPEIPDRTADNARLRKIKAEQDRKKQEDADRRYAENLATEEARQASLETGRYEARAKERAEKTYAESEQRRADAREEERRRKQREKDEQAKRASKLERDRLKEEVARRKKQAEEAEAKVRETRRDKDPRPPVRDPSKRQSRRNSFTHQTPLSLEIQQREHEIALAEVAETMRREREIAEKREAEERAAELRQQQATQQYWDPRGGDRYPVAHENPAFGRRGSISGRRPSISSAAPPTGLTRTNSQSQRRVSIHQNNPPPIDTTFQSKYSMRPQSSHRPHAPPPLSFPAPSGQTYSRPPSAHASASAYGENPFQPAMRNSPPMATLDPWDNRNMQDSLPQVQPNHHQSSEDFDNTLRRRGEDVIARAADRPSRTHDRSHQAARQATKKMGKVVGFEDDYDDSSSENSVDKIAGYGPRLGLGQKPKKKH